MSKKIKWTAEFKTAGQVLFRSCSKFVQIIADVIITILLVCVLTGVIVVCAFSVYIKNYVDTTVDLSLFDVAVSGGTTTTQIYGYNFTDRTNRVGEAYLMEGEKIVGGTDSEYVTYDRIPENMINAVIAIEDKRFRTHSGVDWKRTIAAGLNFFLSFDDSNYGGSTITQQLIKNVTGEDDYTIQRKIQEIFWALDLETKKDKEEIIELYLNIANFGSTYYGVQAAAYNYFSKDVSELTLVECAAIASITQNPSKYNPLTHPENNRERREYVLYEMLDQGLITQREYEAAHGQELTIKTPSSSSSLTDSQAKGINSWYTDMVIEDVIADLVEQKGISRQMASIMVYNGGLRIYSLVDQDVQNLLETIYLDDANFPESTSGLIAQSSAIVIDPETGDILGVVGARREKTGNRIQNYATQTKRSPGSSMKPLAVYAQGIESGLITWASVYDDTPYNFTASETGWPKNSETFGPERSSFRGLTNVSYALTHSLNTISVKVLEQIGVRKSFDYVKNVLHIDDLIESGKTASGEGFSDIGLAALGLGQLNYGVTVREMTSAYSVFVNNGVYNESHSYLKVTDSEGNIILENNYEGNVAFSENTMSVMNLMMKRVVTEGTAKAVTFDSLTGIDVAGKTGSAGEVYDRWFIGYTPYYICGIWYGYDYPKTLSGTNPCLDLFDDIMIPLHQEFILDAAVNGTPYKTFNVTGDIVQCTFCADSGKLATDTCALDPRGSRLETGYFIKGTEPTEYCDTHVLVRYDAVEGGIDCGFCPEENIVEVALVKVNRDFNTKAGITIQDAQYSVMELPYDVMPYTTKYVPYYYGLNTDTVDEKGNVVHHQTGYTRNAVQYNHTCLTHFDKAAWTKNMLEQRAIIESTPADTANQTFAGGIADFSAAFTSLRRLSFTY